MTNKLSNETARELLVSVTAKDCEWSYTKGSGKGGQKRNKTSSAVHCKHIPSGAHAFSQDGRSQSHNKQDAFLKMVKTKEFKRWLKIESCKKIGLYDRVEAEVNKMMRAENIKTEVKDGNGKWVEAKAELEGE